MATTDEYKMWNGTIVRDKDSGLEYKLEFIGSGVCGRVYKAVADTKKGQITAAFKFPREPILEYQPFLERADAFMTEKMGALANHPNIVKYLGWGNSDGKPNMPFLKFEYVPGKDLGDYVSDALRKGETLNPNTAMDIIFQIMDVMEECHKIGIVHSDLTPANVRIGTDGKIKVMDFDFARIMFDVGGEEFIKKASGYYRRYTGTKGPEGSLLVNMGNYIDPAGKETGKFTRQSDVYSIAMLAHLCLTGITHGSYLDEDSIEALKKTGWDFIWPEIAKGLTKREDKRYATIGEMREVIGGKVLAHTTKDSDKEFDYLKSLITMGPGSFYHPALKTFSPVGIKDIGAEHLKFINSIERRSRESGVPEVKAKLAATKRTIDEMIVKEAHNNLKILAKLYEKGETPNELDKDALAIIEAWKKYPVDYAHQAIKSQSVNLAKTLKLSNGTDIGAVTIF